MQTSEIISTVSAMIAIIALFVAIKSWHKSRAIYSVEKINFFNNAKDDKEITEKLNSGKYTILSVDDPDKNKGVNVDKVMILGKIKK